MEKYQDKLKKKCPMTCKVCQTEPVKSSDECVLATKDKQPTCSKFKQYCSHPKYEDKLAFHCPATCGVCEQRKECRDAQPEQCGKMKRFCSTPKFQKVMKFKCAKTCGFC